jgi:hypothetical protein
MNKNKKYKSITIDEQINYLSKLSLSALFSMWISLQSESLKLKFKSLVNTKNKQDKCLDEKRYCLIIIENDNHSFLA